MTAEHQHNRGVLDTNAVIGLPRIADAGMLPAEPTITSITLAELSVGPLVASDASERARRQVHLQQAENDFEPLPFDDAAARAFGQVATDLRSSGRKRAARAYDALIAATAISNGLPLYTANPADFEGITELEIVALHVPDAPSPSRPQSAGADH